MDWFKKKTKEVSSKVTKIHQDQKIKKQTFSGTGHVLNDTAPPPAPAPASIFHRPARAPELSDEQRDARRQQQAEAAAKRTAPQPKRRTNAIEEKDVELVVASDEESSEVFEQAKALEKLRIAESGFNPYQATFSSSTEARTASTLGPDTNSTPSPSRPQVSHAVTTPKNNFTAATATTLKKLLQNIIDNPDEEKYQKLRLSNNAIQTRIVAVPEAVALLHEIGFEAVVLDDGEEYLVLNATRTSQEVLQRAVASL